MNSKKEILIDRAAMLKAARIFFEVRSIIEIDAPILTSFASIDEHIDLIESTCHRYLHSSPEYALKRLLVENIGDIFFLGHVFRQGEIGHKHNPEFMMAEWYRLNFSFHEMIEETIDFIKIFIGNYPLKVMSYRETFLLFTGIDLLIATKNDLMDFCIKQKIPLYYGIENEEIDALLNIILAEKIEPHLGKEELFILTHYPASQSALARKTVIDHFHVSERFEIYFKGIELANGYHELSNANEQKERFLQANQLRVLQGKKSLPIDHYFLASLEKGLPDCCGVAVGFDRLMMLRHNTNYIDTIMPFSWDQI